MTRPAFGCAAVLVLAGVSTAQETAKPIDADRLRAAAAKPLRLLQQTQGTWYEKAACASCHHQILPALGNALAHGRGVVLDAAAGRESAAKAFAHLKDLDTVVQGTDYIDDVDEGWKLVAAHAARVPSSLTTAAAANVLAKAQRADGSWYTFDSRPPQSFSRVTTTAVCARAVAAYLPDRQKAEREAALRRARDWLLKADAPTTEDRAFRLLGLAWTGADDRAVKDAAARLLAGQRADGGWSQTPRLGSDAYSTGEALYALAASGLPPADPAYQNGLRFLLNAQEADGSWRVESRLRGPARLSPKYFPSGFPHGRRHQYSSAAGTAWAAIALLLAVPADPDAPPSPPLKGLDPEVKDEWVRVVLTGTAAELEKALAAGLDPNAKTAKGTTPLMMAAADPAKVKRLLARGADPAARADSGFTPLVVAARYGGNAAAVRLLLKRPAAGKPVEAKVLNSALFLAAAAGDVEAVGVLLDAGAVADEKAIVLEKFYQTPLVSAVRRGDAGMTDLLLRRGADPNAADEDGMTPLGWAAVNNQPGIAKALLAKGAAVNRADGLGMTPLLHAASVDTADAGVAEALLAAGADRAATDKDDRTARELAETYRHAAVAAALARPR